jgi:RNA polymerase sigma-70 factor (ECF subfamily)
MRFCWKGYAREDAKDLTQEFFARLLEKEFLSGIDPSKGKFRTFLLKCLKNFLANEWDKAHAEKRGGKCNVVSLDEQTADGECLVEPVASTTTPEEHFDLEWAITIFDAALRKLKSEWQAKGKVARFDELHVFLSSEPGPGHYNAIGARLDMDNNALSQEVLRLRKRYFQLIRQEIGHTISNPAQIEQEMRYLRSMFLKLKT